jgi:GT2 family glycosyltransferase
MQISIVIINYNTYNLTCNCIETVKLFTHGVSYEIIVVDNGSTEHNADEFIKKFPDIRLIKNNVNGGFSKGNNMGIEKASGEYILLLNSDTILKEDSISKSMNYLKSYENAGVLGCRMIFPDGKIQYTARRSRSISWELLDLFRFIPMIMPYKKRSRLMLGKYFRCDENIECDWVNGAFFTFSRKILEQMPEKKLDDRFFMYGEDQLWCWQIRNLGYKILFYTGTTIIHINSGSTDLSKQLVLRKTMLKNELEIMRLRKDKGVYYYFFVVIYGIKETARNFIKLSVLKFSGKPIK